MHLFYFTLDKKSKKLIYFSERQTFRINNIDKTEVKTSKLIETKTQ